MSYRSDHDAALARVDALEHELAVLRNEQPPAPPPKRRIGLRVAMAAALCGVALGVGHLIGSGRAADDAPAPAVVMSGSVRGELRDCAAGKELRLTPECRALVDGLATDVYSDPDLRAAIGAWGEADHELEVAAINDGPALDKALAHRAKALQQIAPLL